MMFCNATTFNQPLEWDTAQVTDMSHMFCGATAFNQPLEWDTSRVTDMSGMFSDATTFNQHLEWDMENVRSAEDMLTGTLIEQHFGITSLKGIPATHAYFNWHRRKNIVTVLSENGFIDGSNVKRHRVFEVKDLQRFIVSFI